MTWIQSEKKIAGQSFFRENPRLYNLRGLQDLARVYGPRPAITNFNRRACFGMGQAFRLCSICFLLLGACRVHPFPASPLALGKNERAVLQAPCFQWHILSEQLQNFIAWNRILSTRNKIRYPHHSRYSDILYKREQRCLSRKYEDLKKRNKKKGETTRQNIQILLLF